MLSGVARCSRSDDLGSPRNATRTPECLDMAAMIGKRLVFAIPSV